MDEPVFASQDIGGRENPRSNGILRIRKLSLLDEVPAEYISVRLSPSIPGEMRLGNNILCGFHASTGTNSASAEANSMSRTSDICSKCHSGAFIDSLIRLTLHS